MDCSYFNCIFTTHMTSVREKKVNKCLYRISASCEHFKINWNMWWWPEVVIIWSRFTGMKLQPVPPGQILPYDYMGKLIFITARRDRFPPDICLQKPVDSHWFKNVHKMIKFYEGICLLFSRRLTSYLP